VSIVAHLADAATATPTASVFPNDTSRTHGKGRVVARHGANFGPVDVLVNGAVAFPDLANGQQEMADLKRGTYKIAIAPAGTSTEVFSTELKVKPGRAYNAYAVGTPANGTFEVLLQVTPIARHCDVSRGEGHD
jgi:NAD(P)-dependent dehydrogenase (short-subunit alcohol dehydrogenase family)